MAQHARAERDRKLRFFVALLVSAWIADTGHCHLARSFKIHVDLQIFERSSRRNRYSMGCSWHRTVGERS